MNDERQSHERFYALDSFRGLAALIVALGHAELAGIYLPLTVIAVDFFFVLSGFVLAHRYFYANWSPTSLKGFLWQRVIRLWPLHVVMTIIIVVYDLLSGVPAKPDLAWRAFHSIFLTNLAGFSVPSLNPPSWSISAEIIVNVIFVGLLINRRFFILIGCLLSYAALAHSSRQMGGIYQLEYGFIALGLLRCFGGFLLGVLCYDVYQYFRGQDNEGLDFPMWMMNLTEASLIFVLGCLGTFHSVLPYSSFIFVATLSIIIIVFANGRGFISKILKNKLLVYLGTISYSIYLVHFVLFYVVRDNLKLFPNEGVALIIFLALVILFSHLSYEFVEKPSIKYFRGFKNDEREFKIRFVYASCICLSFFGFFIAFSAVDNIKKDRHKLEKLLQKVDDANRKPIYLRSGSDFVDVYKLGRNFLFVYPNCGLKTIRRSYVLESFDKVEGKVDRKMVRTNPILNKFGSVCAGLAIAPKGTDWVTIRRVSLRGEPKMTTDKIMIADK
jgi:peptidoglycan/LPS O-acetylase OafA/YrhL